MLIPLGEENQKTGAPIKRDTIQRMVRQYRSNPNPRATMLRYAHFDAEEVIKLLIANGVMSPGALGHVVPGHGIKIYIGQHIDSRDTPIGRGDYEKRDTTIICTTELVDRSTFRYLDQLKDNKNVVAFSSATADPEEGIDQASTYPPDNPYNQGVPPTTHPVPPGENPEDYDIGN